jgi:endoglucanase
MGKMRHFVSRSLLSASLCLLGAHANAATAIALPTGGLLNAAQFSTKSNGSVTGGTGWALKANGYIEQSFQFPVAGTYTFDVAASGTPAAGVNPNLRVSMDGQSLADISVDSPQTKTFTSSALKSYLQPGAHTLRIAFTNDKYVSSKEDRNLFVASLKIWSPAGSTGSTGSPASPNPLAGAKFFVNPYSQAANALSQYPQGSADWKRLKIIADQSVPNWLGDWNTLSQIKDIISANLKRANAAGQMPIFTIYAIPNRDCGSQSAGGYPDKSAYMTFINTVITALGTQKTVLIYEPDALPMMAKGNCATPGRTDIMKSALTALTAKSNLYVYVDAGHSHFAKAEDLKPLISQIDPNGKVRGFSLNISNFRTTATEAAFCKTLSAAKPCVIDTSRNGNGPAPNDEWCNPTGRAIGAFPSPNTGDSRIDAFLWIKAPGSSDGKCNGGPAAGVYVPEFGIEMVRNAGY